MKIGNNINYGIAGGRGGGEGEREIGKARVRGLGWKRIETKWKGSNKLAKLIETTYKSSYEKDLISKDNKNPTMESA